MKSRLLTGAIGVALFILTLPAEARRPSLEGNDSGAYEGNARVMDFDNPSFWPQRQHSRETDSDRRKLRRQTSPRQTSPRLGSPARAARPSPRTASPGPSITARAVTSVARHSGGGARGCLSAPARALLDHIEGHFGAMQIISTCRPGARIAGSGRVSRHASGNAVDFNAGGRKADVVRWLISNHKAGGIMTYAGMSHIHVDIGYPFVALNSGGGR